MVGMIYITHTNKSSLRFSVNLRVYLFRVSVEYLGCSSSFFYSGFWIFNLQPWEKDGICSSQAAPVSVLCQALWNLALGMCILVFSWQLKMSTDPSLCSSLLFITYPGNSKFQIAPNSSLYFTQRDHISSVGITSLCCGWEGAHRSHVGMHEELISCASFLSKISLVLSSNTWKQFPQYFVHFYSSLQD